MVQDISDTEFDKKRRSKSLAQNVTTKGICLIGISHWDLSYKS